MKKIFVFIALFIAFFSLKSQIVTTYPQYPTTEDSVTVYFNATSTPLQGYTGDVYVHTGVNLSDGSTWQLVKGSWGNNSTQPKLTKVSTDHYKLTIKPSIRSYYGITANLYATAMCFVFRSADATKQTSDQIYNVYSDNTVINIDSNYIFSIGDYIPIKAVSLGADSIKLYIDSIFCKTATEDTINYTDTALTSGRHSIWIFSYKAELSDTTVSSYFVRSDNILADLPQNIIPGINYIDDSTVTLAIYAPYKQFIFILGDFNNWQLSNDYELNKDPDTAMFWITISHLTPKKEYAFEYYIDGQIYIADPYTDKILDPDNDKYIPVYTYPSLKSYPTGAKGIISIFQTAQTLYNWNNTSFQRPNKNNLVIYELLVRDFVSNHNYQTLIDTIAYLKKLGINAIELMPVSEFEGNSSWGYNPDFYFAPDKYYGTKNKLKEFIDTCHSNGIAVIMDIVLNHSFGQSPLVQMYLDRQTWKVTPENPWYNVNSPNTAYSWGYDFNHQSTATRYFIDRILKYWLTEFQFDGFRFDFSKGFTNTSGDGWAYDANRISILKHYYDIIQQTKFDSYLVLEHFTDNSEETVLSNYGMLIWGNINNNYCQASMGYSSQSDFSWISYLNRNWNNPNLVGYMESHDEERVTYKNITYGNSYQSYDIKELNTALKRMELAAIFFITVPGPKMIWQFGELGYDYSIDYNGRVGEKPIHWDYLSNQNRSRLNKVYADLINLKLHYPIFQTDDFIINTSNTTKEIDLRSDTGTVVIIGNFDVVAKTVKPNFNTSGTWYEYFSHTQATLSFGQTYTLAPGEYRIYSTFQMPKSQIPQIAEVPLASNVQINGDSLIGDVISANYFFYDANGEAEGSSIYKWYRSATEDGSDKTDIQGAILKNYIPSADDLGKYIFFSVTPISQSTDSAIGKTTFSNILGPITISQTEPVSFPNPFNSIVHFYNIEQYTNVLVSTADGKTVDSFDLNGETEISRDYSSLNRGIYFVKFSSNTKKLKFKIIKM